MKSVKINICNGYMYGRDTFEGSVSYTQKNFLVGSLLFLSTDTAVIKSINATDLPKWRDSAMQEFFEGKLNWPI